MPPAQGNPPRNPVSRSVRTLIRVVWRDRILALLVAVSLVLFVLSWGIRVVENLGTSSSAQHATSSAWEAPSHTHWMGTDGRGHDVYDRVLRASHFSLSTALLSTLLACFGGLSLAAWANLLLGRLGYRVLAGLARLREGFPAFAVAVSLMALFRSGYWPAVAIISGIGAMGIAGSLSRYFLDIEERGFVRAAQTLGQSRWRLFTRHVAPNGLPFLATLAIAWLPMAMLLETGLNFAGLGFGGSSWETWGGIMAEGRESMIEAPWMVFYPGIVLVVVCALFGVIANLFRRDFETPVPRYFF